MDHFYSQRKNEMKIKFNVSWTVRSDGIKDEQIDFPVDTNAKREIFRMASFRKCRKQMPAVQLALAGFYYIGPGDRVACFSCRVVIEDFQLGDNPLAMKWHKQGCLHICGGDSGNIPLNDNPPPVLQPSTEGASSSGIQQIEHKEAKKYLLMDWISKSHKQFLSSLNLYKELDRRKTFTSDWNFFEVVSLTNSLAQSGFYYLGNGNQAQCVSCGVVCHQWSPDANAYEIHRTAQPNCRLLNNQDPCNIPITDASTYDSDLYGPSSSGNVESIVKMEIPEHYPASAQFSMRKHTAVSSRDDIQINMMMSANIPGHSGLSSENTNLKTALPSGPISSYFKTVSVPVSEANQRFTTQNLPSSIGTGFNKLEISSSSSSGHVRDYLGVFKSSEDTSSSSRLSTLEPEISEESLGAILAKKETKPSRQLQKSKPTKPEISILPSYPPKLKENLLPQETIDRAPTNFVMQSFLGQAGVQTAPSIQIQDPVETNIPVTKFYQELPSAKSLPTSPVRGFKPIESFTTDALSTTLNNPKRHGSWSGITTQPQGTFSQQDFGLRGHTGIPYSSGLLPVSGTMQNTNTLRIPEHLAFEQNRPSGSEIQAPGSVAEPFAGFSAFVPPSTQPGLSTPQQGLLEQANVTSTKNPLALSTVQPQKLQKMMPVPVSQAAPSESTLTEVIQLLDPYKSGEPEPPSHTEIGPPQYDKPQLDVGDYVMEPGKTLLKEEFPCKFPSRPEMGTLNVRVDTFPATFPVYASSASITDIAEAGFYSIGSDDEVCCWYCGMIAANWCTSLDPWVKHCLESPRCQYLLRNRGKDYVESVSKDPTWLSANRSARRVRKRTSRTVRTNLSDEEFRSILAECLRSDVVRNLLSMGFENKLVIQLMKERVMRVGRGYVDIEEALDELETLDPDLMDWTNGEEKLLPRPATPPVTEEALEVPTEPEPSEPASTEPEPSTSAQYSRRENPWRSRLSEHEETEMRRELKRLKEEKRCKVCLDRDSCMIFTPCGHICACADCTKSLRKCPICRQRIDRSYHTYSS